MKGKTIIDKRPKAFRRDGAPRTAPAGPPGGRRNRRFQPTPRDDGKAPEAPATQPVDETTQATVEDTGSAPHAAVADGDTAPAADAATMPVATPVEAASPESTAFHTGETSSSEDAAKTVTAAVQQVDEAVVTETDSATPATEADAPATATPAVGTPSKAPAAVSQHSRDETPLPAGALRFSDLGLSPAVQKAIEAMGFTHTTPIQGETIPALMAGRDVIGQAKTGTGKTAAFGVPLIEAATVGRRALVLAPTRELAVQVQRELQALGKGSPVDVICLIGGAPFGAQVNALQRHPQAAIVATPGRVCDHLGRGTLALDDITMFVLDEADEMLSMGFQDELDQIVAALPEERQTVLFTATLAKQIERLAKKALHDPITVRMGAGAAPDVRQGFATVAGRERLAAIGRIMEAESPRAALLFARTRARVEELVAGLEHLHAEALHGGMGQPVRDSVMRRFRDGKTRLLVATDVAARGLDVNEIDLVMHDEPAGDVDTYIHRIGRTGRAGRSGASILFIGPGKMNRLKPIQRAVGQLEKYTLPSDDELAAIRSRRVVEDLRQQEPGQAAKEALKQALASGMDAQDVALRALEAMLLPPPEPETSAEPSALALKVGKMDKVHPGAIVGVLTNAGGLRADDIGRIDILDKMSVVEVPEAEVERLCDSLGRVRLSGRPLMPRPAEDWRFKTAPRQAR